MQLWTSEVIKPLIEIKIWQIIIIIIFYYFCNQCWSALKCRSIFIISFGYLTYIPILLIFYPILISQKASILYIFRCSSGLKLLITFSISFKMEKSPAAALTLCTRFSRFFWHFWANLVMHICSMLQVCIIAIWSQSLILNSRRSYAIFGAKISVFRVPFGYKMAKMMDLQKCQ